MGKAAGVIGALVYLLFFLIFSVGPILLFFVIGKLVERSHYRSLVRHDRLSWCFALPRFSDCTVLANHFLVVASTASTNGPSSLRLRPQ